MYLYTAAELFDDRCSDDTSDKEIEQLKELPLSIRARINKINTS